jgi:hypothetical protein
VIFFLRQSVHVNQQELLSGKNVEMKENQKITFQLDETEKHSLKVESVSSDYVTISIQSEKITFRLKIGEERNIDINKDGVEDLYIKLVKIENNKPHFLIRKITPLPPKEKEIEEPVVDEDKPKPTVDEDKPKPTVDEDKPGPIVDDKTCIGQGGVICKADEKCSTGGVGETIDTKNCCWGECEKIIVPPKEEIISCNVDSQCDDNNPNTYNYCYKTTTAGKCVIINETIDNFNIDKSSESAINNLKSGDFCKKGEVKISDDEDMNRLFNNKDPRPCASLNVWMWCKDWIMDCYFEDEITRRSQILMGKKPNEDSYKHVASSSWDPSEWNPKW